MQDLSSLTRDRACIPRTARRILNHWTTRGILAFLNVANGLDKTTTMVTLWDPNLSSLQRVTDIETEREKDSSHAWGRNTAGMYVGMSGCKSGAIRQRTG